ncbi:MAG: hypothetical protein GXO82_04045 [Chlorobi bacterium]|nr:hypothetical protein [Chlorobiota bacterium]
MKILRTNALLPLLGLVLGGLVLGGCGSDDGTNPPEEHKVQLTFKNSARYTYDRYDLLEDNSKDVASKRDYVVEFRGSGGATVGAYTDWFYRIGTDGASGKKDTLFIRTDPVTSDVFIWGFTSSILKTLVDKIVMSFPVDQPPSIPSPKWDMIARFSEGVGYTWDLPMDKDGNTQLTLVFGIGGATVPVIASIKGAYVEKDLKVMVGGNELITYKVTNTISLNILGTMYEIVVTYAYADNPSALVTFTQESLTVNILNLQTFTIFGETQELKAYVIP